jgi:hypothetical protein
MSQGRYVPTPEYKVTAVRVKPLYSNEKEKEV